MVSFACDYLEGAHEDILKAFLATNMEQAPGYGEDVYCARAKEKIKAACGAEDAVIFLLNGGTQTNQTVISGVLDRCEGVIAATTGHVSVHEAGAIEYTGHKVLEIPGYDGKVKASDIEAYMKTFNESESREHMVWPGMVYISHPTEYGTLYSKAELTEISEVCRRYELPLYLDGARLGYALASNETDVSLQDIVKLTDVFYIGGTKVGALCGEAVVFTHGNAPKHFFTHIKQHGALTAKGRLLGIQFDTLFSNDLYMSLGKHAIRMAEKLKSIFDEKGYSFFLKTPTNQQFVILSEKKAEELSKKVGFEVWERYDEDNLVVRFATSWATKEENVELLRELL